MYAERDRHGGPDSVYFDARVPDEACRRPCRPSDGVPAPCRDAHAKKRTVVAEAAYDDKNGSEAVTTSPVGKVRVARTPARLRTGVRRPDKTLAPPSCRTVMGLSAG